MIFMVKRCVLLAPRKINAPQFATETIFAPITIKKRGSRSSSRYFSNNHDYIKDFFHFYYLLINMGMPQQTLIQHYVQLFDGSRHNKLFSTKLNRGSSHSYLLVSEKDRKFCLPQDQLSRNEI